MRKRYTSVLQNTSITLKESGMAYNRHQWQPTIGKSNWGWYNYFLW